MYRSSVLVIPKEQLSKTEIERIHQDLSYPNPVYANTLAFSQYKPSPNIPKEITFYQELDGNLILPRNYPVELKEISNQKIKNKTSCGDPIKGLIFNAELRKYQSEYFRTIDWENETDICMCCPCGHGKTTQGIHTIYRYKVKTIVFVNTHFLARQWIKRVRYFTNKEPFMLTTSSLKHFNVEEHDIVICLLDTFRSIIDKNIDDFLNFVNTGTYTGSLEFINHFGLSIYDECFVKGTLVDGVSIEQYKIGDIINSYNHDTGFIEPKRVEKVFSRNYVGLLYTINFSNDSEFICTEEHPIYTKEFGYITAKEIYNYVNNNIIVTCFSKTQYQEKTTFSSLHKVWNYCTNRREKSTETVSKKQSLLLSGVQKIRDAKRAVISYVKMVIRQQGVSTRENEIKQPNVQSSYETTNGKQYEGENLLSKGRKWTTNNPTTKTSQYNRLSDGVRNSYHKCKGSISFFTKSLQGRFSNTSFNDCNRSGWKISSDEEVEVLGSQKDRNIRCVRVVSCKILESTDRQRYENVYGEVTVYNLHVSGNVNYFAAEILVHNCHRMGASEYEPVITAVPTKYRLTLTATLRRGDGREKMLVHHFGTSYIMPSIFPNAHYYGFDTEIKYGHIIDGKISDKLKLTDLLDEYKIDYTPYPKYLEVFVNYKQIKLIEEENKTNNKYKRHISVLKTPPKNSTLESFIITVKRRQNKVNALLEELASKGRTILVLSKRKSVLKSMYARYCALGYTCALVISETSNAKDEDALEAQMARSTFIFGISQLAQEGLDCDSLDTVVTLHCIGDPEQLIGRTKRQKKGKKQALAIQVVDNFRQFLSIYDKSITFAKNTADIKGIKKYNELLKNI